VATKRSSRKTSRSSRRGGKAPTYHTNTGFGVGEAPWEDVRKSSAYGTGGRFSYGNTDDHKDLTPRYAPKTVLILGRGVVPVTGTRFYPPGQHPPKSPIVPTMGALELVTPYGSRWYGFDRGYINSQLRMVVEGFNKRDEVRSKWPVVPVKFRDHGRHGNSATATEWRPPPPWKVTPGTTVGNAITTKGIRVGDIPVFWERRTSYAGVSGNPIDKLGPKNVVVHSPYKRYTNAGPVETMLEHKVPRYDVACVVRGDVIHPVSDSGWTLHGQAEFYRGRSVTARG
jgi:hypothetical protein